MPKSVLSELERLQLIGEAVAFSRRARSAGSPVAAHSRAVREAVFSLWETYGRSKHSSARYQSVASQAPATRQGGVIYDHAVPFSLIHEELLALSEPGVEAIRIILERRLVAATITREEDQRLTALGLRSRMPEGWDGEDPLARYKAAGIELIENTGGSTDRIRGRETPARQARPDEPSPSFITLREPEDHPRLQASSSLVKAAWRRLWAQLASDGFELVQAATRDGFYVRRHTGERFKIDPKLETLRIKVGLRPRHPPPAALVHAGQQPDWIVVVPANAALAQRYLQNLYA